MKSTLFFSILISAASAQITRDNNGLSTTPVETPTTVPDSDAPTPSPSASDRPAGQWPYYSAPPTTTESPLWTQASWSPTPAPYTYTVPGTPASWSGYSTTAQQSSWATVSSSYKATTVSTKTTSTKTSSVQQATFTGGANGREVYLGLGALVAGVAAVL